MVTEIIKSKNNPYLDYIYNQISAQDNSSDFQNFMRGYKLFEDLRKFYDEEYTTIYIDISSQLGTYGVKQGFLK